MIKGHPSTINDENNPHFFFFFFIYPVMNQIGYCYKRVSTTSDLNKFNFDHGK